MQIITRQNYYDKKNTWASTEQPLDQFLDNAKNPIDRPKEKCLGFKFYDEATGKFSALIIDWDSQTKPHFKIKIKMFAYRTASNNLRYIIPLTSTLMIDNVATYKEFYKQCCLDIFGHFNAPLDSNFSHPNMFAIAPYADVAIQLLRADNYRPATLPLLTPSKPHQHPQIKFKTPICITDNKQKCSMLIKIDKLLSASRHDFRFKFITKKHGCFFNSLFHNTTTEHNTNLSLNDACEKYSANLKCHNADCEKKVRIAVEKYQPIHTYPDNKNMQFVITNKTVLYLTHAVVSGKIVFEQILCCAFAKYEHVTNNHNNLTYLSYNLNSISDAPIWCKIFFNNPVINPATRVTYNYENDYYKSFDNDRGTDGMKITRDVLTAPFGIYYQWKSDKDMLATYVNKIILNLLSIMSYNKQKLISADSLSLNNGLLIFKDQKYKFIKHNPSYFTTQKLDFNYNPKLISLTLRKCMIDYFGEDSVQEKLLQEFFGYCLSYDRSLHKILFMFGITRGGKSTLIEMLMRIVNGVNGELSALLPTNTRATMLVENKVLHLTELHALCKAHEVNLLKQLSSDDSVSVRYMGGDAFPLFEIPKIILSFNLDGMEEMKIDKALKARMVAVNFTRSFEGKADIHLAKKLQKEAPGILNWMLEGYERVYEHGFTDSSADIDTLCSHVQAEEIEFREIIVDIFDKLANGTGRVNASSLYEEALDHQDIQIANITQFGRAMRKMPQFKKIKSAGKYLYYKIP